MGVAVISEAKGMHFYQTIQLRQLQDQELVTTLTHSLSFFLFIHSFHFSLHYYYQPIFLILVEFNIINGIY
jgi:hypothetical protein